MKAQILRRRLAWHLLVSAGILTGGCGAVDFLNNLIGSINPRQVTVELVNDTPFDVDVEMYYSDEQDIPEFALTSDLGTRIDRTVPAGEVDRFTRDCDQLQAIIIDKAVLQSLLQPQEGTDVLRDGHEFGCGDTISFGFTSTSLGTNFEIATDVR